MLTQEQRDILGKELTKLAFAYGVDFPKERASAFINALIEYVPGSFENYIQSLRRYVTEGNPNFPSPIKLQKYINPTSESKARDDAASIQQAIVKYGWNNAKEAQIFLGPQAWSTVQAFGGWNYLCTNLGVTIDPTAFHAQARERSKDNYVAVDSGDRFALTSNGTLQQIESRKNEK